MVANNSYKNTVTLTIIQDKIAGIYAYRYRFISPYWKH